MRYIYNFLCYIAIPFALIRLIWKSRHAKAYLDRWGERFGFIDTLKTPGGIWIHAVSVGEVVASVPLIKQLQQIYPDKQIIITCMTPTGSEQVRSLFDNTVFHVYVPYDLPGAMARFLQRVKPSLCLIMETEIWPNLLNQCTKYQVPTILANARLSRKSARGYQRIKNFTADILQQISLIAVQNQEDAARFRELGANAKQVIVTGSMKFDITISGSLQETAQAFRSQWGQDRKIWIAASTHEGEEEKVLSACKQIQAALPQSLLILVPRHPERFSKVASLCEKQGFNITLRSENKACDSQTQIVIGDSMGELAAFYAASDVAFVGGSLVPVGGHNLLEPAAVGVPAITGPHVFNFVEITRLLTDAKAVKKINNPSELAQAVISWLENTDARVEAGERGRKVIEQNRGAVQAHLDLIKKFLSQ